MSKWSELSQLIEKHAEALQDILSSEFGVPVAVEAKESSFGETDKLLIEFPQRLCLISTPTEPFEDELHLLFAWRRIDRACQSLFWGRFSSFSRDAQACHSLGAKDWGAYL